MTAESPEPSSEQQPIPRLSFWPNVQASIKHIRESVKAEGSNIRKSDPITVWMVPFFTVALIAATLISGHARLVVGVLAFLSALVYVMARIGIVRSMNHRQANMVWHLLMATFISGLLFAFTYLELLRFISPPATN
jgi:hypothetical protein